MAGQHFEHIVFGANQHACWLRCTLCEKTSPRIYCRFTICMKCPRRRREEHEPLWHISTRCVLMKWNCLLLRLFWMGTEDRRAFLARELRNLQSRRPVDDFDNMELFHEAIEEDSYMDDLRAEVSLLETEQEDTSLADRFSRGGLPYRRASPYERSGFASYDGRPMNEAVAREDTTSAHLNINELDETRSNEAHMLHDTHFQDPCNDQGSCTSKPFEGLEQCLPWHQRVWDNLSRRCSCHRRRCVSFQFEERPQYHVVDGYASHREYPILKPTAHDKSGSDTCQGSSARSSAI